MKWQVETQTKYSRIFLRVSLAILILLALAPFYASRSIIQDLFFILTMLIFAQSWNLLAGYAGMVSIGQQAYVGLGAYTLFYGVIFLGLDPLLSISLAIFTCIILALLTAFFVFRLQGAYFAIGTWVFAEIIRLIMAQWQTLGGGTGTSLPRGATREMFGVNFLKDVLDVKTSFAIDMIAFWVALVLAVLTIGSIYFLLRSRQGLGLTAIRDNLISASSIGINARKIKLIVYVSTSVIVGITGALVYLQKARISPDAAFSVLDWTAYVIFIVVIGGIGTIEGPIIGVLIFFLLQNLLSGYGSWYLLILGLLGIATMLFAPGGIWGYISDRTGIKLFPVQRRLINDKKESLVNGGTDDRHNN